MRFIFYLLGAVFMVVAFAFMGFGILPSVMELDSIPLMRTLYENVLCDSSPANPQTIAVVREESAIVGGEMDGGTSYDSTVTCTDLENRTVNVTDKRNLIGGVGFTAFLIFSVVVWLIPSAWDELISTIRGTKGLVKEVASIPSEWSNAVMSMGDDDAARQASLQSIKALYDKGMINQQAYESARDQILKGS